MPGDPIAYAPHLKSSTLPGVQIKQVLFQFARGDQDVPNPANTELIRAANMREQSIMYRADLARTAIPSLPANPHTFLVSFGSIPELVIAAAAQTQIAGFLASDGNTIPDVNSALHAFVNGLDLFVTPDVLPEDFGFLDSAVPSP